jgi:hypothetical protein
MPPFNQTAHRITKKRLSPMIRQHEIMLDFLRNPALAGTLQQLIDHGGTRKKWAANALTSAQDAGFTFPGHPEVVLEEFQRGWNLEVRVYEDPHTYVFGFDSDKGFYFK